MDVKVKIYSSGSLHELSDFVVGKKVGLLTGTFDPVHSTHIQVAEASLKRNFGDGGNDYVWLVPHDLALDKHPVSIDFRLDLIKEFIAGKDDIGILLMSFNECLKEGFSKFDSLNYLSGLHSSDYRRIIGSDRLFSEPLNTGLVHFVHFRGEECVLPKNYLSLGSFQGVSSTQLRNGVVPFGSEYESFYEQIKFYYPNALIN